MLPRPYAGQGWGATDKMVHEERAFLEKQK